MRDDGTKGSASAGPIFEAAAQGTKIATGIVLAALVVLVCTEAFLRSVFNYSLGFAEELTGYSVVMLTFFGAALALRFGVLFQVNFLFDNFPETLRTWIMRLFVSVALIICLVLIWKTSDQVLSSFGRNKFAPTVLRTPLWIPQLLIPAGFTLISVFLVEKLLLTFDSFKARQ
jgi:TRAP-type C4-dicarboxylate transport system permease small subunit